MDQDTTGKSGSRSWRDRLGIDESKPSSSDAGTPARAEPAARPSPEPEAKPAAPKVQAKVVANPAPMAPRPGTAAKAPPAPKPAPTPQRAAQDDAFAERLRKHREAAEEAVKKRSGGASLEKFSFAKKEVEVARAEKSQPPASTQPNPAAPAPRPAAPATPVTQPASAAPMPRPAPQAPVAAPAPAPAPIPQRPAPAAPAAPVPAGARPGNVPAPRPAPQAAPRQQPAYRPPQPGYPGAQPGYPGAQQPPSYRPSGPGYAPPPGARPMPPQGYAPGGQHGYPAPGAAPVPRPPAPPQGYKPAPHGDDDLFQDNGYRPAAPLGRAQTDGVPAKPGSDLRAEFDDPFDDNLSGGYGGRTARDYSQAYREFEDDYEDDEPSRGWGGIIMLILALLFIGALAVGGVLWWQSQTNNTAGGASGGQVPQVSAPDEPAKAEPDATQPAQANTPPQGRKLIYERILSDDGASQPEQIVPREEEPVTPAPSNDTGSDSLPLPLPPPPQNSGSLQPDAAEPAAQQVASAETTDNQEGAAGVEPAASAVSSGPISEPPIPRRKPRNLVASVQNAPTTQFQPVLQPAPQPAPQPVPQVIQPSVPQQGAVIAAPQPVPQPQTEPSTQRFSARDEDPLAGTRRPFNSTSSTSSTQEAAGPTTLTPAPAQQQVALAPAPAPAPAPQPQQPVTSQDLQAFAPPAPSQQQAAAPTGSGYVIQLAAYRSEQEAMAQYQQLKARHGNLVGNLPPAVQQTNLGASGTFYRLGMGPMNSKNAATELCNKLIAAGERDCLVRRR